MNERKLLQIISKITGSKVSTKAKASNYKKWDSLAHLKLLAKLDQTTKGKSSKIAELTTAKSFQEIKKILLKNKLYK